MSGLDRAAVEAALMPVVAAAILSVAAVLILSLIIDAVGIMSDISAAEGRDGRPWPVQLEDIA
jgi:hypothetical protein